jgi:hypothetical protein
MEMKIPRLVETAELDRRLDQMPSKWRGAVEPHLREWSAAGVFVDDESGTMFIGHRPLIGPISYAFVLFPAANSADVVRYEATVGVKLPDVVKDYIGAFNGGHFLEFALSGADMFYSHWPWPVHRPFWHCFDMGGEYVIRQRRKATRGHSMVFASRNSSLGVMQNYAQEDNGKIVTWDRQVGELLASWDDPVDWFSAELACAKTFTDEWATAMSKLHEMYPEPPKRKIRRGAAK